MGRNGNLLLWEGGISQRQLTLETQQCLAAEKCGGGEEFIALFHPFFQFLQLHFIEVLTARLREILEPSGYHVFNSFITEETETSLLGNIHK